MRLRASLGAVALVVALCRGLSPALAEESSLQHLAELRFGSCASLGDPSMLLTPLAAPTGDRWGQPDATPVEQSVTVVPQALMDILANGLALAVYAAPDQGGNLVACGDVGGILGAGGALTVGLNAVDGSALNGTASFAPTVDGDSTLVTVLMVDIRSGQRPPAAPDREGTVGADGSPGAESRDGTPERDDAAGTDSAAGQSGDDGADGGRGGRGGVGGDGGNGGTGGDGVNGGAGGNGGDGGAGSSATSTSHSKKSSRN